MKINKILMALTGTFLLLFSAGCTQADGYIGVWFGAWHLETIDINGEEETAYSDTPEIMFSFQGEVFKAGYIERAEIFGTWSYEGEILNLNAGYNAGNGAHLTYLFNPFPVAMHFPADVHTVDLTVTELGSRRMQWQYIDQNGRLITYNFKKYP